MENLKNMKLLIVGIIMVALSGCYDKIELEDRGFVMTIGIDKYHLEEDIIEGNSEGYSVENIHNESKGYDMAGYSHKNESNTQEQEAGIIKLDNKDGNNRFIVTINKANIKSLIGETEDSSHTISANSETIAGAFSAINMYSNQNIYLGYAEAVVIGETILEDPKLFREVIDTLERNKEISREIFIVTTKGNASDALLENIKSDKMLGMFISKFYRNNNSVGSARVFHKSLEDLSKSLYRVGNAIIPRLQTKDGNVKLDGVAIIRDFELAQWLDASKIKGYLWVLGKGEGITISTEINDTYVPLTINNNSKKLNFTEENGQLICEIDLKVIGTIEGYNLSNGGVFDENLLDELSKRYEKIIIDEVEDTFHLFQNVYLIDAFQFFEILEKKNNDLYLKYKHTEDRFNNMLLRTNVDVKIKSIGSIK